MNDAADYLAWIKALIIANPHGPITAEEVLALVD